MPTATLDQPAGPTATALQPCPGWCEASEHAERNLHYGGSADIELSLAAPGFVQGSDTLAQVIDWISVSLWQQDRCSPVIGMATGIDSIELPDLTLDEAATLARALTELVFRGRSLT